MILNHTLYKKDVYKRQEDNVATCKKLTEMNGIMMLQPMNSNFDAIPIDPLNNNVRCIGKLKKVIKDFDWED